MDIRQLQHFVTLVELDTTRAAAQDQNITQPGLSGSIKRLEAQLGIVLFHRNGRGMTPNAKGLEFYGHAKHILEQIRLARADLDGASSKLFIGLGEVRPPRFAGALHDSLLESYPDLSVSFVEGHFDTLYKQIENGDVDVAFLPVSPQINEGYKRLVDVSAAVVGYPLFESQFCVFCSANHPLAQYRGKVTVDELEKYHWVKNGVAPVKAPYIPFFAGRNQNPLSGARYITAGSQQMAKDLILYSNALGYGPRVVIADEMAAGQLIELDLPIAKLYLTIMEVRRRNLRSSVLDRTFRIAEHFFKGLYSSSE